MIRHVLKRWNANKPSRWSMACAGAAAAMMVPALTAQAQQLLDDAWVATWGSSPSFVQSTAYIGTQQVNNQTIRQIGRVSLGGNRVRIRLDNTFGAPAIYVGSAHIALHTSASGIDPSSDRALTFGGKTTVTLRPNAPAISDPVDLDVKDLSEFAVSIYLPQQTVLTTTHTFGMQTAYFSSPGDFTASQIIPPAQTGPRTTTSRYLLSSVDVSHSERSRAIVTLGDSITEGVASTTDLNHRWPDRLAERLLATGFGKNLAVVNEGIGGNRLLHGEPNGMDAVGEGTDVLARFDRDVIAQTKVKFVVVLEGINDIGFSAEPGNSGEAVGADKLIQGYRQLIDRAHLKGLKIIGATLTPFQGSFYYTTDGEAKRQTVNAFIRNSRDFDGVIDFDRAVHDPANPVRFIDSYQSGDWLHPSDAGYKAMADSIDLNLFTDRD
jgi:lysophospholipase L1-like esterase